MVDVLRVMQTSGTGILDGLRSLTEKGRGQNIVGWKKVGGRRFEAGEVGQGRRKEKD